MCIILFHPKDAKLPTKETFEYCWEKNSDGAGLLVVRDGWLRLWKGFMSFPDLWAAYRTERLGESDTFAIHFRLATAGGVEKGNCHPFPIVDDPYEMKKLKFRERDGLKSAVMHNGIFGKGEGNLSDTMVYVRDELFRDFGKYDPSEIDFDKPLWQGVVKDIEKDSWGSKLLIVLGDRVLQTGWWNTDDDTGIEYSNYGWKRYTKTYTYTKKKYDRDTNPYDYSGYGAYQDSGQYSTKQIPWLRDGWFACPICLASGGRSKFSDSRFTKHVLCLTCGIKFIEKTGEVVGFSDFLWDKYCREESKRDTECRELDCDLMGGDYCADCFKNALQIDPEAGKEFFHCARCDLDFSTTTIDKSCPLCRKVDKVLEYDYDSPKEEEDDMQWVCGCCPYNQTDYCDNCENSEHLYECVDDYPCESCKYGGTFWCKKCKHSPREAEYEEVGDIKLFCYGCGCDADEFVTKDAQGNYCSVCKQYVPIVSAEVMTLTQTGDDSGEGEWGCPLCESNCVNMDNFGAKSDEITLTCTNCATIFSKSGTVIERGQIPESVGENQDNRDWCPSCGAGGVKWYNVRNMYFCEHCKKWIKAGDLK